MKTNCYRLALAAVTAIAGGPGAHAASCPSTSLCLDDTVTYNGATSVVTSYGNPTNGPINVPATGVSYFLGDSFGSSAPLSPTTAFPVALTQPAPTGATYNFYDDFFFTTTTATTNDAAVISGFSINSISNLQIRIFGSSGQSGPLNGAPTLGLPTGGSVDGWSTPLGTNGSMSVLLPTGFPSGTYDLQIRGTVNNGGTGSYGGDVEIEPVPLPAALPLMFSGLGMVGGLIRRRRPA